MAHHQHPQALVDEGSEIGNGTRVWAFAHIMKGAVIGENCNVGDYAMVEGGARLGNNCTVKNGVQVWEGVTAEDGVFLGPNCVFTNDMFPRAFLKLPKEKYLVKTMLREGCTIGANATVVAGNTIGRFAFVAAGALVTKDVPDYALVLGSPARFHSWICKCGTKIAFEHRGRETKCSACEASYVMNDDLQSIRNA